MSDWQPIETAPKDDTILIAFDSGPHKVTGLPVWRIDVARWFFDDWACVEPCFGDPYSWEPTHWMPLPDPPAQEKAR